jgi:hypothetical protein
VNVRKRQQLVAQPALELCIGKVACLCWPYEQPLFRHHQPSRRGTTGLAAAVHAGTREAGITYLTLIPIAGGVVIASGGEPLFHLLGFVACLLATSGRALKSVVQVSRRSTAEQRPYNSTCGAADAQAGYGWWSQPRCSATKLLGMGTALAADWL